MLMLFISRFLKLYQRMKNQMLQMLGKRVIVRSQDASNCKSYYQTLLILIIITYKGIVNAFLTK